MIRFKSKNFTYEFYGNYKKKEIEDFAKIQENDFRKICKYLNIKNLKIIFRQKIYPTLKEKQVADPQHSISRACARANENTIYRVLGPEMEQHSFPHEIVHLVMRHFAPKYQFDARLTQADGTEFDINVEMDSTSFYQEGLAIAMDEVVFGNKLKEGDDFRFSDEWVRLNKNKQPSPTKMINFVEFCSYPALLGTPVCASFCKYLIIKYGLDKFLRIYRESSELKKMKENLALYKEIFEDNAKKIEINWKKEIIG